jgi:hypothetical protein
MRSVERDVRFPARSPAVTASPVTFPSGRPKLDTSPISTGLVTPAKTIGRDVVAFLAASAGGPPEARMMSTFSASSLASCGSSSTLPSVNLTSITTFWPSLYPRSERPCRNASNQRLGGRPARRNPITSFAARCARAMIGKPKATPPRKDITSRRFSDDPLSLRRRGKISGCNTHRHAAAKAMLIAIRGRLTTENMGS